MASSCTEKYDIIIIGGGISGLYTAWRLAKSTNLKILVLEGSHRFGGRFMTCQMPGGFPADMGAMRYLPQCHPLLEALVNALEVSTETISQVESAENKNKFQFFMRNKQLSSLEEFKEMFSMTDADLHQFLGIAQFYFNDHPCELDLTRAHDGNFANSTYNYNGQKAKDVSVAQYLSKTSNAEVTNLSWSVYPCNDWQLAVADGKLGLITKHWDTVKRVTNGYEAIIKALVNELDSLENVDMKRNQKVSTIEETKEKFVVSTLNDQKYFAEKVVYACSHVGLNRISLQSCYPRWQLLNQMLNKVSVLLACKIFLTYTRPWWEECGVYQGIVATDLPMYDATIFGDYAKSDSYATLLAAYPLPFTTTFAGLDLDTYERFVNKVGDVREEMIPSKLLVEYVDKQLKTLMGCPDLEDQPVCAAKYFWGVDETAGISCYPKLGVDSNQLHWDSLKPFDDAEIYITGDTFVAWEKKGCHIGFSEGALLTSERILCKYFGLKPFINGLDLENPWPQD